MEHAQALVRSIVRAFYGVEHIVIVDALVFHGALSLIDLAQILELGKQVKVVQRYCGKLREAGLVSVHSRMEAREGSNKPIMRDYLYIDYRRAIDATKYRIHLLDEQIKQESRPTTEKKDLVCTRCRAQWTLLDVLDCADPAGRGSGFLCKRCGHLLETQEADEGAVNSDDRPAQFNRQFAYLLHLLEKIDESIVPAVTGEEALAHAVPLVRDETGHEGAKSLLLATSSSSITVVGAASQCTGKTNLNVKGAGDQTNNDKIEVLITTQEENSAAETAAAAARRAAAAAQNVLPSWHTHSTITGELTGVGQPQDIWKANSSQVTRTGESVDVTLRVDDSLLTDENSALESYFKALEEEQQQNSLQEAEMDAYDDDFNDDEEDEFEDIPALGLGETSPLSSSSTAAKKVKVEFEDSF